MGRFVANLGHTKNPKELIPGDAQAILGTAQSMANFGAALEAAGDGLKKIDDGGWSGKAADAFRNKFNEEPARWTKAADAFLDSADALVNYAIVLIWAQQQAVEAVALWEQGQAETQAAHDERNRAIQQAPAVAAMTFIDPGKVTREKAQAILKRARDDLHSAGDDAERIIAKARDKAPPKPTLLQQVGHHLKEFGKGLLDSTLSTLEGLWKMSLVRVIVDPVGYIESTQTSIQAAKYAAQHPVEFAKSVADIETWKTNPAYAAGAIVPDFLGRGTGRLAKVQKIERTIGDPKKFDPEMARGMSGDDIAKAIPSEWRADRSSSGGGTVFRDPNNPGRQIRIMPGYVDGNRPDPVTHGPYIVISQNGSTIKIPLEGNPTLGGK